jgi:hypothetical protein
LLHFFLLLTSFDDIILIEKCREYGLIPYVDKNGRPLFIFC